MNDREFIASLLLKQYSIPDITEALKESPNHTTISITSVKADISIIRKQWAASVKERYDEYVGAELDRTNLLEKEAWVQWESSVLEGRPDKAYLDIIIKCVQTRVKVLGLDKTTTNNINIIQNNIDARQQLYNDYGELQKLNDSELLIILKQETEDRKKLAAHSSSEIVEIPAGMA